MTTLLQREKGKSLEKWEELWNYKKPHYSCWFLAKKHCAHSGKWRAAILQERDLGQLWTLPWVLSMNSRHNSSGNIGFTSSFPQTWLWLPLPWGETFGVAETCCVLPRAWWEALELSRGCSCTKPCHTVCRSFPLHSSDGQHVRKRTLSY